MLIREAKEGDYYSMANIYNEYIGKSTMDLSNKTNSYFNNLVASQSKREGIYVVDYQSVVIGWGIIKKYSDREGYARAAETSVYIAGEYLGQGYGRKMKTHLLEKAREKGYKHLVAKIWANNKISIQYNLNFGYSIVGTQKKIGYVNEKWVDVVIMQYVFPD